MKPNDKILDNGVVVLDIREAKKKINLTDNDDRKKSQATLLIEIGKQGLLFHCPANEAYSEVNQKGVFKTFKVKSKDYREYLSHKLYELTQKGANNNAMGDALATLEAMAKFDGKEIIVAVRSYFNGEAVYIDLGDDKRKIIKVHQDGWLMVDKAPIKFIRKTGMTALPDPKTGGKLIDLLKYINIKPDDLPLIYGWMFCALADVKPYPVLILQGEQGTGKSTTSKLIRSLVDPNSVPLRSPPKDTRDLLVSAANTHIVCMDNLSGINAEMSDCLCRLSTGGGHDVRALFTDNEQYLIELQKPIIVNGIDDVASRPDLSERAFIINLPEIKADNRQSEGDFWNKFRTDKRFILGCLLDALASGLKHHKTLVLNEKPRMADVAQWVSACEVEIGFKGEFMDAHKDNQRHAIELGIEASPIGDAIMTLMNDRQKWIGKPTELYNTLADISGLRVSSSKAFPASTKGMGNIIKRLSPSFRKLGIEITKLDNNGREYTIENRKKE